MKNLLNEIAEFFIKNLALLPSLLIGVVAKLAIDSKAKKLTRKDIVIKTVLGCFVGYVVCKWLESHEREAEIKIYVPVATLLGESLVMWLIQNTGQILNALLEKVKKGK